MQDQSAEHKSFSYWRYGEYVMEPDGPIGIITHQLQPSLADNINRKLRHRRQAYVQQYPDLENYVGYLRQDYRIDVDLKRFNTGEGKATLLESVRGHDLYILSDVVNHGIYTNRFNQLESLSPDDHFQDLVRIITATHGLCRRVNVIMPYLYEGRRYSRTNRGSMDCALMLRHLFKLGISNFITYDAHDGRVANAVPRNNFENFSAVSHIIGQVLREFPDLELSKDRFMIISPKETGISRAIFYATMLHVPLGTFYRVYQGDGTVSKDFLGDDIEGRDVWIVDDMIDTGKTILESAYYLKEKGARRVFVTVSFAHFTKGYEQFNQAYDFGVIDKVFSTNLIYQPRALTDMPWFSSVDMSENLATIIDALNHNASLSRLLSPEKQVRDALVEHKMKLSNNQANKEV